MDDEAYKADNDEQAANENAIVHLAAIDATVYR